MNKTGIPYLDYTWNPTHGCTHSGSPGCDNCWAKAMAKRQAAMGNRGYNPADPFKVVCDESRLTEPLKRKKPARIGVSFMGDLCHDDVPGAFIDEVVITMAKARQHTFVLLTKRPERMARYWQQLVEARERKKSWIDIPMPNVHLGTSISTQADADRNIPELLKCPAAVRWLSVEPLLEAVDLGFTRRPTDEDYHGWSGDGPIDVVITARGDAIGHVVVGCESGPKRRPCNWGWIAGIAEQCRGAGVPCYVKQMEIGTKVVTDPGHPEWPTWAKQELPKGEPDD